MSSHKKVPDPFNFPNQTDADKLRKEDGVVHLATGHREHREFKEAGLW